jgi:hypothetical protein
MALKTYGVSRGHSQNSVSDFIPEFQMDEDKHLPVVHYSEIL